MAKNKKFMASTGFVGLTAALALSASPALAAPQLDDTAKKDDRAIVYEVENLGDNVSLLENDLELPENVDFKTFAADVEKDSDNVKTEDVLDENDEKTGERLVLTVEEQGTWTFESDLEGNLVKIDFVPVEGFEGDPVLDYIAEFKEEIITGTITLDYPNDEKADAVEPLTEDELAELQEDADKTDDKAEEVKDDEKVESDAKSDETVEDEKKEEKAVEEVDEEKVVKVAPRALVFSAPAQVPAAPAKPAPAAPAPSKPNFPVPELKGESDGGTVKLTFGKDGEKLPKGTDASTLMLILGSGADPDSTLSSDRKQLEVPNVGTFKVVDGGNAITFTPVNGYSGTATGHYVVRNAESDASNEGKIVVGVSPAKNNGKPADEGDGANSENPADSSDNNDGTADTNDDPNSTPEDNTSDDSVSSENPTLPGTGDQDGADSDTTSEDNESDSNYENSDVAEASRDNLSHTGVDAGPAGLIAGLLALFGAGAAALSARFKKEN